MSRVRWVPADAAPQDVRVDLGRAAAVRLHRADRWDAEHWARTMFEQAPGPIRRALLLGWRLVLGLQLLPDGPPDQVLGWRLADSAPGLVTMRSDGPPLAAIKVFRVEQEELIVSTYLTFADRTGRLRWALVAPVHRVLEPYLLARAVRHGPH